MNWHVPEKLAYAPGKLDIHFLEKHQQIVKKYSRIIMDEHPTSDGACKDNRRHRDIFFERFLKIEDNNDNKFSSDFAKCNNMLSPDLVEVVTQPMTPKTKRWYCYTICLEALRRRCFACFTLLIYWSFVLQLQLLDILF